MKKWLKLWIVALSLVMLWSCIYKVNADTTSTVKVEILEGNETCTWSGDYDLWSFTASAEAQAMNSDDADLTCELYKNNQKYVKISITNLTAWSLTINKSNLKVSSTAPTVNGTLSAGTAIAANTVFSEAKTRYQKAVNTVGTATWPVTLWGTIPAWQPVWVYTGTINVSLEDNA